ncbi:hypothetical protein, partial [Mesorhizobium sp.]|uniref:hypothetical protein n=1 Tax=Mesorhizobium sp. TaxID=1871066 RepID=UPI0025B99CBE
KLKNGSGYFLLKDSVPCPIPTNRKRCAPRRSFEADITQEAAAFNHDRIGRSFIWTLSPCVVAQMTRFGLTQKALINQSGLVDALSRANPATAVRICGAVPESPARESPWNRRMAQNAASGVDFSAFIAAAC